MSDLKEGYRKDKFRDICPFLFSKEVEEPDSLLKNIRLSLVVDGDMIKGDFEK